MFSRISCEFERIEFAETAAKRIRETVNGPKKIRIKHNRNKYKAMYNGKLPSTHGDKYVLLPTAVTSYNYITGQITRPLDRSMLKEPVLTEAVTLEAVFQSSEANTVSQILVSSGGYSVSSCTSAVLKN